MGFAFNNPNTPLGAPPPGVTTDFSHPRDEQRYAQMVATIAVLVTFSTSCVLARLYTRVWIVKQFGWDDACALLALCLNVPLTACWIGEINTGITDYDWNVRGLEWFKNDSDTYNFWNALATLLFYFVFAFVKISILMLYLRLLGPTHRKLRIAIYVMVFITFTIVISCTIALLKFCTPVEKIFKPSLPGTCTFQPLLFFVQALFQVATDFVILLPPIPMIWRLNSSVAQKMGFVVLLCTGFAVTAVGIVRTVLLAPGIDTVQYILYTQFTGTYWCILEINLAIAVCCLPALNQLFRKFRTVASQRRSDDSPHTPPANGDAAGSDPPSSEKSAPKKDSASRKKKRSSVSQIVYGFYSELGHTQHETDQESILGRGVSASDEEERSERSERKDSLPDAGHAV